MGDAQLIVLYCCPEGLSIAKQMFLISHESAGITVHTSLANRPKWSIYYAFSARTGLVALHTRKKRSKQPIPGYPVKCNSAGVADRRQNRQIINFFWGFSENHLT